MNSFLESERIDLNTICFQIISSADLVLVGLGEEMNDHKRIMAMPEYGRGKQFLEENGLLYLLPAWNEFCSGKLPDIVTPALEKLSRLIADKNSFVLSTATDGRIAQNPWKHDRLVMPCGQTSLKQCAEMCLEKEAGAEAQPIEAPGHAKEQGEGKHSIVSVTEGDRAALRSFFEALFCGEAKVPETPLLGSCPDCGAPYVLNTVCADSYNEASYLDKWSLYRRWLQGTINRKVVLLELGVGLEFPSVIRWPFEKIAFYNQKATLIRVHEKLYQLPEDLSGRGISVALDALSWLGDLQ